MTQGPDLGAALRLVEAPDRLSEPTATKALVEVDGVSMAFEPGRDVLSSIDLTVAPGEFLAIVGPSGCGKSTLLRLIAGLVRPAEGQVLLRGRPVDGAQEGVGFMFQRDALLPWASVTDNIRVGLDCRGVPRVDHAAHIEGLLALLGLQGYGDHRPTSLSGGMRQRVALGRLLAYEPKLYLMDEPFGALDVLTKLSLGEELLGIWQHRRKSVVFVTHDIEEAVSLADRVVVMTGRPGRIKSNYRVALPRPRDLRAIRRLPLFHKLVEDIWTDIAS